MLNRFRRLFAGPFRIGPAIETAAHLATAITLVLFLWQIREGAENERRQRALSYVQDYNADPISRYRQTEKKAWLPFKAKLDAVNEGAGMARSDIDAFARHVVERHDGKYPDDSATLAIQAVADFYDQVALCVRENVCDERIVRSYFKRGAVEFWGSNQAVIKDLRPSMSPGLGENLERLFVKNIDD